MRFGQQTAVVVGIGSIAALCAAGLGQIDFVRRVENVSYDWRVAQTAQPVDSESPVLIVDINESSIRALEPLVGRWPWPRMVHAAAIDYMRAGGARVVAFDILFGERERFSETFINGRSVSGEESDRALVDAVRDAGNVVLLAGSTYEGLVGTDDAGAVILESIPGPRYQIGSGWYTRPDLQLPFDELVVGARAIGHDLLIRDPGSDFARRMVPFIDVHGHAVPSLGLSAAMAFLDVPPAAVEGDDDTLRIGAARMPITSERRGATEGIRQTLLRFQRPVSGRDNVTSMFPGVSYFDVLLSADQLASGEAPAVPPSAFADKLVFVGASAAGTFDRYLTPFGGGAGGVELHATLAQNVLDNAFMRRAPSVVDGVVTLLAALAASAMSVLLPLLWAVIGVVVLVAVVGWGVTALVGQGVWMAAVVPGLAVALASFGGIAWRYFVEGREKRHVRELFGRYVSKDVIEALMADPAGARLGGQRREMTVLFSDIRGFTAASEVGTPEDVVAQLNEYFAEMVEVLFRHQGTLDKFVGDMVMGLFGAPLRDPHHADHAVAAALDMAGTLDRLNARWKMEGRPVLDIGIGINTGEMIAGNIGAESIMSYTVIGDAVNLGARLESLNKDYGTRILISDATRARLTTPVRTREIGPVVVKGRTKAVVVHEVVGVGRDPGEDGAIR